MQSFRLSAKALDDLKSIGRFTLKMWGREQRNIYLSKLDESFHLLADQPFLGTPQGGVISPLLANIYLHKVLDVWFGQEVAPRLRG